MSTSPDSAVDDSIQQIIDRTAERTATAVHERMRRNPFVTPEWLSLQECAAYTGFSEGQMSAYIKNGVGPRSVKLSANARRIKREWANSWVEAGGASAFAGKAA